MSTLLRTPTLLPGRCPLAHTLPSCILQESGSSMVGDNLILVLWHGAMSLTIELVPISPMHVKMFLF